MDVFTMVVVIVAIGCGAGVANNYLRTRRLELERGPNVDLEEELAGLKERVAALEAIVTDERYHLKQELDRLERQA
jgi:hypothetical protein